MNLQEMSDQLDKKWPDWDMYRSHDRSWMITADKETFRGGSLAEVFQAALDYVVLLKVPKCPLPMSIEDFEVRGVAGSWAIELNGRNMARCIKTKATAVGRVALMCDRNRQLIEAWEKEYGWSRHKTAGVDFKFSDDPNLLEELSKTLPWRQALMA
jgi:hypothetical protein